MTSKLIYSVILISMVQFCFSAPETSTKKFKVGTFHSLEIGQAFEIHIQKGSLFSVSASGQSADLERLEVDIVGSVLKIKSETKWSWGWNHQQQKVILNITMPKIQLGDFSGATKVYFNGFTNEEQVRLNFSGASKLMMDEINADKLMLNFSGATKAELSGQIVKLEIETSGASQLMLEKLIARDVDVSASGASRIQLNVQKTLKVEASGASKITYKGRPSISSDLSGASFIRQDN